MSLKLLLLLFILFSEGGGEVVVNPSGKEKQQEASPAVIVVPNELNLVNGETLPISFFYKLVRVYPEIGFTVSQNVFIILTHFV